MPTKRIVVVSDLHCGHVVGLTPPDYQYRTKDKYGSIQSNIWEQYVETIDSLGPIDVLVCNGDAIDGKGERSGGTELITTDRSRQSEMAIEALSYAKAKQTIMTYGTAYHTGSDEDWEKYIAKSIDAKIGSHEFFSVNGVIFDCKHHIGGSASPYGKHTSIAKDKIWNTLWAEKDLQPKSNITIRSHVHLFSFCGDSNGLNIITPALQGFGSKFGSRRCSGMVNMGIISFDVTSDGKWTWTPHLFDIKGQSVKVMHIS